jgi:hypothetical protein
VNNWTYEQIVKATMRGEIVPPIKIFEAQGAADERARIMAAVEAFIGDYKYTIEKDAIKILGYVMKLLEGGVTDA